MAVFLFFGDDTYSQREKLDFWCAEFEKKHGGDMNISQFAGADTTAHELFQACSAVPFLAEKRLVIVKNFLSEGEEDERARMVECVEKIPDSCVLIFSETVPVDRRMVLYKKLQKTAKCMEFPALTESKLAEWIEKKAGTAGGQIERDALFALAEITTGDLYRLENEIQKLMAYAQGRAVTKRDVELLVSTQLSTSIFKLTDGIGQKNERLAVDTLHQLIESGEELFHILHMIMRQFRIIMCVKDLSSQGLSRDEIRVKMKEKPFTISNTLSQSRNFSFEQLKRAYELLIQMDFKLKSGGIKVLAGDTREFVLALDRLVLELCR